MVARPGGKGKSRFRARLAKSSVGQGLVVRGSAPKGSKLRIRLLRRGEVVARKGKTTMRRRWRARFRVGQSGRYRAIVTAKKGDRKLRTRTKAVRVSG